MYRRFAGKFISFRNMLQAVRADATAARLLHVLVRSSRGAFAVSIVNVTTAFAVVAIDPTIVHAGYIYIAAAAAVECSSRAREQGSSQVLLRVDNSTQSPVNAAAHFHCLADCVESP